MVSRNRKALTLGLVFTHLATLMGPLLPEAQADTMTPALPSSASYSPFNFTGTPVSFQVSQAQSLSNLYGSCFEMGKDQTDPLVSSIVQLTTGKDKNAGKNMADPSCSAPQTDTCSMGVSNNSPSCPVDKGQGQISAYFNGLIGVTQNADCCAKYKMGKLQEANKELSCINEQNSLLAQQIKSMQSDLQSKFQQAQKDLSQIDTVVGDRMNQMEFIQSKLGGDKNNGTRGLLALQADMQKVITGELPLKIKTFEDTIAAYNQQQVIFQQRVQNQKMALARQCFTSPDARYQCAVNSTESCSFAQLIEAKYYELSRSVNGQIQRNNKSNQAQAQSKKAALDALFQTIFGNMASDPKLVATSQQEAQAQQQQAGDIFQIKSPQDLQTLYGSQLSSFNIPGLDVQQLFLNKFEQCYEQAQSTVTSSMSDPTSQYSLSVTFMQKQQKDIRDGFVQFYKGYADMYAQFWSTMGQTAPLDTSKCEAPSTSVAGMLQCAKDLSTNLEGAYTGKTANSAVTILVKGNSTNPVTQFNFKCNGVNGCVTVMQNLTTNLKSETQKLDQTKKNYIQQANQTLDQYKLQMQQVLNVQNQALAQRLSQLKSKLAANGVTDPLSTQPVQKVPLTKTKTADSTGKEYEGLYEMPSDLLGAIGGDLSPPMIDPNSSTFDSARSLIGQVLSEDRHKESEINSALVGLMNSKMACLKDARTKAEEKVVVQSEQIVNCAKSTDWCSVNSGSVDSLLGVLSKLDSDDKSIALSEVESTLMTGSSQCRDSAQRKTDLEKRQQKVEARVADCKNDPNCLTAVEVEQQRIESELASLKSTAGQQKNCSGVTSRLKPAILQLQSGGDASGDTSSGEGK